MAGEWVLGIETSNPSSGPRGEMGGVMIGPGVALAHLPANAPKQYMQGLLSAQSEPVHGGDRHEDDLMPAIARLCVRCAVKPKDLRQVAVSVGPGGYTSLRIAIATAKMMAEATGAEIVPVPSAKVAAWRISFAEPAVVCLSSKGSSAYGVLLPGDRAWWDEIGATIMNRTVGEEEFRALREHVVSGKKWIAAATPLGTITEVELAALRPKLVIADRFLPDAMRFTAERGGASITEPIFAAESVIHLSAGIPAVDPVALAPLYPREPEAVTQWRKRHGGG
jgi:tRNA threonylcarbamoyladenosine biosynthesis protein TsaB